MLSHLKGVRPQSTFSRSIIRDVDITDANKNYASTNRTAKDNETKKKLIKNNSGRKVKNTTKKDKVGTVKSVDTGLSDKRKIIALKEQIRTLFKGLSPSNTQQDTLVKGKLDEVQKVKFVYIILFIYIYIFVFILYIFVLINLMRSLNW